MLEFKTYFQNKRNLVGLIVLLILILAIPLGIYLAKNTQIFRPRADVAGSIALAEGNCVTILNGEKVLICKDVPLRLISPFNESSPSASPSSSSSASASPSPSPTSSPSECNPKKFDENTWVKELEACKDGEQRVIFTCQNKTKTKKQKCDPVTPNSSPIPQSAFNGPHNIPGKIEAEDFDNGGEGVAYHDTDSGKYSWQDYRINELVDIINATDKDTRDVDNSRSVVRIRTGEWLEYTVNVANAGNYTLELRYYPDKNTDSSLHIEFDGQNISTISTSKKDGKWQTITKSGVALTAGQHVMRVVFDRVSDARKSGGYFNWVNFKLESQASRLEKIQKYFINNVFAEDKEASKSGKKSDIKVVD